MKRSSRYERPPDAGAGTYSPEKQVAPPSTHSPKTLRTRWLQDAVFTTWGMASLVVLCLVPLAMAVGLSVRSLPVLEQNSAADLILSSSWEPMNGRFGFWPFLAGSLWVTLLSFVLSAPLCLGVAIYLTEYGHRSVLRVMQPLIDILAGIPSVVYGMWGVLMVVPLISDVLGPMAGVPTSGYSVLAGAIVLAIMCIPYMLNMLIELFQTVPVEAKEASFSIGATSWETVKHVTLRRTHTGIIAVFGLGMSKALGETIAVLMVVGNVVRVPASLFDPAYPLPALIANNFGEMMSIPMYDAALMLAGLILFVMVLLLNAVSRTAILKAHSR